MADPGFYDRTYYAGMRGEARAHPQVRNELYERFLELITAHSSLHSRILDAGCGRGDLMATFWQRGARDVWGVDFSPDAVALSRERMRQLGLDAEHQVREGSLERTDLFPSGHFDLVVMTDVVEHLPGDALLHSLRNVKSWLRPGGRLFVHTFPTLGPHRLYQGWLRLTRQQAALDHLNTAHCHVQTRRSLRSVLVGAGFDVRELWIANDFTLTSTAFQSMAPGLARSCAGFLIDDVLGARVVSAAFDGVGLGEWARPSIYANAWA